MRPSSMVLGRQLPAGGSYPGKSLGTIVGESPMNADDNNYEDWGALRDDYNGNYSAYNFGNMPSDFISMDSCTVTVAAKMNTACADDTLTTKIAFYRGQTDPTPQVLAALNSNFDLFSTPLNDMQSIYTFDSTDGTTEVLTSNVSFGYVNTTATKAEWDAGDFTIGQEIAKTKGPDGIRVVWDYVALTGTYTGSTP